MKPLGRPRRRWMNDINMDGPALTELIWPKSRVLVDTVKSILVQYQVSTPS